VGVGQTQVRPRAADRSAVPLILGVACALLLVLGSFGLGEDALGRLLPPMSIPRPSPSAPATQVAASDLADPRPAPGAVPAPTALRSATAAPVAVAPAAAPISALAPAGERGQVIVTVDTESMPPDSAGVRIALRALAPTNFGGYGDELPGRRTVSGSILRYQFDSLECGLHVVLCSDGQHRRVQVGPGRTQVELRLGGAYGSDLLFVDADSGEPVEVDRVNYSVGDEPAAANNSLPVHLGRSMELRSSVLRLEGLPAPWVSGYAHTASRGGQEFRVDLRAGSSVPVLLESRMQVVLEGLPGIDRTTQNRLRDVTLVCGDEVLAPVQRSYAGSRVTLLFRNRHAVAGTWHLGLPEGVVPVQWPTGDLHPGRRIELQVR
jgi:hypothetical protein